MKFMTYVNFIAISRLRLVNAYLRNLNCSHVNGGMWTCVWILPRRQHRSVLQKSSHASIKG